MEHIAIDVGGRESQICVRSGDGTIVEERRCATGALTSYLGRRAKGRVILETCAEGFAIADAALGHGHEVRVVPATLVRSLGVGNRGVKTDRRDAQVLSEVEGAFGLAIRLRALRRLGEFTSARHCDLRARDGQGIDGQSPMPHRDGLMTARVNGGRVGGWRSIVEGM